MADLESRDEYMYDRVCKQRFDDLKADIKTLNTTIENRFVEIRESQNAISSRMFKGNGGPPWDIRLDRLERHAKAVKYVLGMVAGVAAGLSARLLYLLITS